MKITKKAAASSTNVEGTVKKVTASTDPAAGNYDEAIGYIRSAMSSLYPKAAAKDVTARTAIANLAVILLEMQ